MITAFDEKLFQHESAIREVYQTISEMASISFCGNSRDERSTEMSKVWLITGAGRGMGTNIARAALAAGYKVVATGRDTEKVTQAVGESADLLGAPAPTPSRPSNRIGWRRSA